MASLQPVDRLEIQVLVDNVTDTLSSTPALRDARVRCCCSARACGSWRVRAMCCANHGLALVITAHGPDGPRTLLFDGGPVDYAVERNGVRLGIDFGAIGAAMLSHGHWDHAGGLPRAAQHDRAGQWRPQRAAVPASRHVPPARHAPAGWRRAADGTDPDAGGMGAARCRTGGDRRAADLPGRPVLRQRRNPAHHRHTSTGWSARCAARPTARTGCRTRC